MKSLVLRRNRLLYSIRWRFIIIYLIIIAIAFGILSIAVSSLFERYIVSQRVDDMKKDVSNIAVRLAPYLRQSDASEMFNIVSQSSQELGGRFLVLSNSGIVQADSFSTLNGMLREEPEVNDILYGNKLTSYGFHKIKSEGDNSYYWALFCTSPILSNGNIIGVALYSNSIQDVVNATNNLQLDMVYIYIFVCAGVLISSLILSSYITKPVRELTSAAMKISNGDLAFRAEIKGKNEIAELGSTFNMMCDRLQNIDQQRGEFVSDASHELKTPLASMKILVESILYQDNVEEKVYKEFLSDINGEIDRLNSLITDLLLLSKMDDDSVMLNVEKVDLNSFIDKIVDSLKPIAEQRNIIISVKKESAIEIECDALKVRQAINNLIENAIKYSNDGGHVNIRVFRIGNEVQIEVADDGLGMEQKHLNHIFERFYRVDKARSRETGGTGLGLYIVRRIALLHNGRVEVSSELGKGSVFTLILPIHLKTN